MLGTVYLANGKREEALPVHERLAAVSPAWRGLVGVTYALVGDEAAARRRLEEQRDLHARAPTPWTAFTLTVLSAALGEADEAALALAWEPHHAFLAWLAIEPLVAPLLEGRPAFEDMRRRLGLQEGSCCYRISLFGYPAAP
ncbi:MAG TPA: hypothetical protein VF322_14245 [Gammaproteobacteria bacterium]